MGAGCGDDCPDGWQPVSESVTAPVLSVAGRGEDDVFVVGGGLSTPGIDALALHYDGQAWQTLNTGIGQTLWWVWPEPAGSGAWFVGEDGVLLRWDGTRLESIPSTTNATLYGVWGTSANAVWIVGGTPGGSAEQKDIILYWDGTKLTRIADAPVTDAVLFKVWGSGADDIWVAGERGTMLHRTAQGWRDRSAEFDTVASLLTVHGCSATEVYAVGGQDLWAYDGQMWSRVTTLPAAANGVACGAAGVLAVGNGGLKYRLDRSSSSWVNEQLDAPFATDFHGAYVTPTGQMWAVGGNFQVPMATERYGVLGVRGCPHPGPP